MRNLLLSPLVMVALLAGAWAGGRAAGWWTAAGPMWSAAVVCLLAAELAVLLPVMAVVRGAGAESRAQAVLAGTVAQMVLTMALAGAAWAMGFVVRAEATAFLAWLLAGYWLSLLGFVVAAVKNVVRSPS